ncbi:hypothetical protein RF640_17285 [Kocuria sp. CPCC 205231]|uniref:hypothetical protein n=1 Tax=Kocuria sp. CPCC 205231 TaxID=3073551 RepID=UPI0034D68C6C
MDLNAHASSKEPDLISQVFGDMVRMDSSPASHAESSAQFLNRVQGAYWDQVRQLIEDWASRLDRESFADLTNRLRSPDDRQSQGAFLELYLHESFLRAGYRVEPHPVLEGTLRRPDFLAIKDGHGMYVEARSISPSDAKVADSNRLKQVYDALDQLDSPNFFLWVNVGEQGPRPLPAKPLRRELEQWLETLDPDEVTQQAQDDWDDEGRPTLEWSRDGWGLHFEVMPKSPEARGEPGLRALGAFGSRSVGVIDEAPSIKRALSRKGSAYGTLDYPFVVALGTYMFDSDHFHVMNALYGQSSVALQELPDGRTIPHSVRTPDGYWSSPSGWRRQNVAGVLMVNQLQPYSIGSQTPNLWVHPDTHHELEALPIWNKATLIGTEIRNDAPRTPPLKFFGLPSPWPAGEPFPGY